MFLVFLEQVPECRNSVEAIPFPTTPKGGHNVSQV